MFHQGCDHFHFLLRQTHCYGSISFIIHVCLEHVTPFGAHTPCALYAKNTNQVNLKQNTSVVSFNAFHEMDGSQYQRGFSSKICEWRKHFAIAEPTMSISIYCKHFGWNCKHFTCSLLLCIPGGFYGWSEEKNQWKMSLNSMDYCLFSHKTRVRKKQNEWWCRWFSNRLNFPFFFIRCFCKKNLLHDILSSYSSWFAANQDSIRVMFIFMKQFYGSLNELYFFTQEKKVAA